MAARTCLIHIGTHKTATKSLQLFFFQNAGALRAAGVHVCDAGRHGLTAGNHSLARDLVDKGESSHLISLAAELSASECGTPLITAEDFSLLHGRPDTLRALFETLRSVDYRPVIVAYLRPQAAFAESMYAERRTYSRGPTLRARTLWRHSKISLRSFKPSIRTSGAIP